MDDPLERYVPEAKDVLYPTSEHPPIRLRNLLTHTAGIPTDVGLDPLDQAALLASLQGLELDATPGTVDLYSNAAVALAGIVVSRVSGEEYRQYVSTHILDPLAMSSTGWIDSEFTGGQLATGYWNGRPLESQADLKANEPAGGLYSSASDLGRLAAFELSAWPPRSEPEAGSLSRSSLRESQLPAGPGLGDGENRSAVGVGWLLRADDTLGELVWHDGSLPGYSAVLGMLPQRRLAVIVLANASVDWQRAEGEFALRALATAVPAMPGPTSPGLRRFAEHLLAYVTRGEAQPWPELIAPSAFRQQPIDKFVAHVDWVRREAGRCSGYSVLPLRSKMVRFECANGSFRVYAWTESHAPERVEVVEIHDEDLPQLLSPLVSKELERLVTWLATARGGGEELFSPGFTSRVPAAKLSESANRVRSVHGRCQAGQARAVRGEERMATVDVPCERGTWRFSISLEAAPGHRIDGWWW